MNPVTRYGGIIAGIILIAFGVGSTLTGFNGRSEVRDTLKQEQITGTPDMDKSIANQAIDTGAKSFDGSYGSFTSEGRIDSEAMCAISIV